MKVLFDQLVFCGRRFIELPKIELPEESWMQFVLLLRDQCTCAFGIFREVASGDDLKKFLYVPISHTLSFVITRKVLLNFNKLISLCSFAGDFWLVDCFHCWKMVQFVDPCIPQ